MGGSSGDCRDVGNYHLRERTARIKAISQARGVGWVGYEVRRSGKALKNLEIPAHTVRQTMQHILPAGE